MAGLTPERQDNVRDVAMTNSASVVYSTRESAEMSTPLIVCAKRSPETCRAEGYTYIIKYPVASAREGSLSKSE